MRVPDTRIQDENDHSHAPALRAQIAHLTALVEALKSEVIRLRRHRYGSSAERLDPAVAPQLPLAGCEDQAAMTTSSADLRAAPASRDLPPPRLRWNRHDLLAGTTGKLGHVVQLLGHILAQPAHDLAAVQALAADRLMHADDTRQVRRYRAW